MTQETIISERQQQGAVTTQVFNNQQFGELRVAGTAESPLFCLADVCRALGLVNVSKAKSRLDVKGVTQSYTLTNGGKQLLTFIDEPNLYRCIFRSDKEEAKQFQDWVFNVVLPSIRKTGGYMVAKQDDTPESIMARAVIVAKETMERQQQHIKELENENAILNDINDGLKGSCMSLGKALKERNTAAEYASTVLKSTTTWNTNVIAKGYGMSAVTLNKKLEGLGIQYKQHGVWLLTADYQGLGYVKTQTYSYLNKEGETCTRLQTEWTEKGRLFLHRLHKQNKF